MSKDSNNNNRRRRQSVVAAVGGGGQWRRSVAVVTERDNKWKIRIANASWWRWSENQLPPLPKKALAKNQNQQTISPFQFLQSNSRIPSNQIQQKAANIIDHFTVK